MKKEKQEKNNFSSILSKEKFSPEEERELTESVQKMVDGLNEGVIKEDK